MERCIDCNSLLTKTEKVCVECGTKVGSKESSIVDVAAFIAKIMFYLSLATLIASPFVDRLPSVVFCLLISCALLFLMRTTLDYSQRIRKR